MEYFTTNTFVQKTKGFGFDPSVEDAGDKFIGTVSKHCTNMTEDFTNETLFECYEWHPVFGSLTLTFVNLPATFILGSIIGLDSAGKLRKAVIQKVKSSKNVFHAA